MLQTTLAGKFAPDANQCFFNSIAIIPTHTTLVPVAAGADGESDALRQSDRGSSGVYPTWLLHMGPARSVGSLSTMTLASDLPVWPPSELKDSIRSKLITQDARDFALSHGLVYRALPSEPNDEPLQDTTIHAPTTIVPTPFPRDLFEKAQSLQPLFNKLYARVAMDANFLRTVMKDSVIKVDDFQRRLFDIWHTVQEEGASQSVHLGLFRSDYLMHADNRNELELRQVEFNTIAASFGALCTFASNMHRHLLRNHAYSNAAPCLHMDNLPQNKAIDTLVSGLVDAHKYYVSECTIESRTMAPVILFVVQPKERNAFDQRALEYEIEDKHDINVMRMSLDDLQTKATVHGSNRKLFVQSPLHSTPVEVSVVYFRSGYGPDDYTSNAAWDTRLLLERSHAIKCPNVALQLAGSKKVQQVLSEPNILEKYIGSDAHEIRSTFSQLWPLDDSKIGREALVIARSTPEKFVMKPQREGGSHNIYKHDIVPALDAMKKRDEERQARGEDVSVKEHEGYILMSLIDTPKDRGAMMLRAGCGEEAQLMPQTVSELGIYGTILFGTKELEEQRSGGYLLRTKSSESNEGGVAVGFSVIDTPLLV